jgi:hypothetical protein
MLTYLLFLELHTSYSSRDQERPDIIWSKKRELQEACKVIKSWRMYDMVLARMSRPVGREYMLDIRAGQLRAPP